MKCKRCKRKSIDVEMKLEKTCETECIGVSLNGKHSKSRPAIIESYKCPSCGCTQDHLKE